MPGRSIRIFLVDGSSSGVRTAELGLSTIKALAVPRASLAAVASREELEKTGVYVLIGNDSEVPGLKKIYIGEGDTLMTRLSAHNKDENKDFWDECVLFVSKDQNLTKAHVRYVEGRLIQLAASAKRASLTNGTAPSVQGWLPEADEVEMEEFIVQARLLLGTLGYDLFEQQPIAESHVSQSIPLASPKPPVFRLAGDGYNATCIVDSDAGQFVVTADSLARKQETPSLQPTYKNMRAQLIASGILIEDSKTSFRFAKDYPFGSPTAAAQVVVGFSVNGRAAWRTEGGKSLADWQNAQLPEEAPL